MATSTERKPIVPEFTTSKITDRKLNEDNNLQWRKIVQINLTSCEKKNHLYTDPPNSKTNE